MEQTADCPTCAPTGYKPSLSGQAVTLKYEGAKAPFGVRGPYTGTKYRIQRTLDVRVYLEDSHAMMRTIEGLVQA